MVKVEFPGEELTKYEIQKWLKSYKISYTPFMKKEELLEVVKSNKKMVIQIEKEKKKQLKLQSTENNDSNSLLSSSLSSSSSSSSPSSSFTSSYSSPFKSKINTGSKSLSSPFKKIDLKKKDSNNNNFTNNTTDQNLNDSNIIKHEKIIKKQNIENKLNGTILYVFLSSTFKDMSGERDHLIKVTFPALNVKAKEKNLTIVPIDLRWGLTKDETTVQGQIELCLKQIDKCPIMITMLGSRFGWVPTEYKVSDNNDQYSQWLSSMPLGHSITSLEVQYSLLTSKHCVAAFRDSSFQSSVPMIHQQSFQVENKESETLLADLKSKLIENDHCNVIENYPCKYGGVDKEGKVFVNNLESFGDYIFNKLWSIIEVEFPTPIKPLNSFEQELQFHKNYFDTKSSDYYGRENIQKKLKEFVTDKQSNDKIGIVYGEPGSGKSSTLAYFSKDISIGYSSWKVLYHFVGCSIDSTQSTNILYKFSCELNEQFNLKMDISDNHEKLRIDFPEILKKASRVRNILLVIDDLDEMSTSNQAHQMDWLPDSTELNDKCKILLSCYHGKDCWEYLHLRSNIPFTLSLPPLEIYEKNLIATKTLEKYSKKLEPKLLDRFISKTHAKFPLFIKLACEELRVFGSFEKLNQFVTKGIPDTIDQLILNMITRLEEDMGKDLIKKTLCFIALSRFGLSEEELLGLLKEKKQQHTLPFNVWAPLLNSISPLLRGGDHNTITFFHNTIVKVIIGKYLPTEKNQIVIQNYLADYYLSLADPLNNKSWLGYNSIGSGGDIINSNNNSSQLKLKPFEELPYHLMKSKRWDLLSNLFMDLRFIEAKIKIGLSKDLVENYIGSLQEIQSPSLSGERWVGNNFSSVNSVEDFCAFVQYQVHNLKRFPMITCQQANNLPDGSVCNQLSQKLLDQTKKPYFKWINKLQLSDYVIGTLAGHEDFIRCVLYRDDGKLIASCSDDKTIRIWSGETSSLIRVFPKVHNDKITCLIWRGNHLISVGRDKKILMWDEYGKVLADFTDGGHSNAVWGCCVSGDGKRLITASWDQTAIVWDIEKKSKLFHLKKHTNKLSTCAYSHNNKLIATGCWNGELIIWDSKTAQPIKTIKISDSTILFLQFSPDDQFLSVSSVDTFTHVFNTSTWTKVAQLEGHIEAVISSRFSYDGKYLVSCSDDKTIRVFETKDWLQVSLMTGHSGRVISCAFHPNSEKLRIITGATDKFIKIWDPKLGQNNNQVHQGHRKAVSYLQYIKSQDILVSASEDKSIRIWNHFTKNDLLSLKMALNIHSPQFELLADEKTFIILLSDGRVAVIRDFQQFLDENGLPDEASISTNTTPIVFKEYLQLNLKNPENINNPITTPVEKNQQQSEMITHFSVNPTGNGDIAFTSKTGRLVVYNIYKKYEVFNERLCGSLNECKFNSTGDLLLTRDLKSYYNILRMNAPSKYSVVLRSNTTQTITSLAWSKDHFALCLASGDIELYNIKPNFNYWKTLKSHVFQVHGLSFSPNGKYLFSASYEKHSILWDIESSAIVVAFPLGSISTSNILFNVDNYGQLSSILSDYTGKIHHLKLLYNQELYDKDY
ncbi:hypothetical protein RB653_003688 [Dictyostelium firmibasis]|uniref:WD40 repeat-containing protein n=1 Tax=Dictyostelium firmibasis TaxID=79012 RepID=A0AAN7U9E4_9MYCE